MIISKDIPGGNIALLNQDGFDIYLEQEIRDTTEWWFYFSFKATAEAEGTYVFHFENGDVISRFGPAVSDDGLSYRFEDGVYIDHKTFKYNFEEGQTVYFAFSYPYLPLHFEQFASRHPELKKAAMPKTEKGREQYHYIFGNRESKETILITCRHHACEASANFVLEGLVEGLLSSPLTSKYEIHIIPFVDLDGVVDGDQGKSRSPHDHNRDYIDNPIYSSIRFIKSEFKKKKLAYYFDLHCPGKWGTIHDHLSIIEGDESLSKRQQRFSDILASMRKGEIPYERKNNIEYLAFWNKPSANSRSFFVERKVKLGFTLEIPFFGEKEKPYSQQGLVELGSTLSQSLVKFDMELSK